MSKSSLEKDVADIEKILVALKYDLDKIETVKAAATRVRTKLSAITKKVKTMRADALAVQKQIPARGKKKSEPEPEPQSSESEEVNDQTEQKVTARKKKGRRSKRG